MCACVCVISWLHLWRRPPCSLCGRSLYKVLNDTFLNFPVLKCLYLYWQLVLAWTAICLIKGSIKSIWNDVSRRKDWRGWCFQTAPPPPPTKTSVSYVNSAGFGWGCTSKLNVFAETHCASSQGLTHHKYSLHILKSPVLQWVWLKPETTLTTLPPPPVSALLPSPTIDSFSVGVHVDSDPLRPLFSPPSG